MFSQTKYRSDVQVLRGLAVLAVVLFHADKSYFPLGYLGVDIFFVISGFVVTPLILRIFTSQANRERDLLSNLRFFYKRRFYRLAPALVVTLTISTIIIFFLGPISDHQRFARQGIATLLLVGNVGAYNYSGDYFSPNPNPLVHTWSLAVEEQIYIFLPILLSVILYRTSRLRKFSAVALGLISVMSFTSFLFPGILQPVYSRVAMDLTSQISFYSPIDRAWQFTAGGMASLAFSRYQNRTRKIPSGINLLNVIAIVVVLFSPIQIGSKVSSIFASLFALIVIMFNSFDVLPNILTKKIAWIGDRSYSIYLVHMPLIYIAKYSAITAGDGESRIIPTIFAVFASIVIGALSYSKIENRFRMSSGKNSVITRNTLVSSLLIFLLPFCLFMAMNRATNYNYWGLDVKYPQVSEANSSIPSCSDDLYLVNNICVNRNTGATKTAMLIGDSHAGHISLALTNAAKDNKWKLIYWQNPIATANNGLDKKLEARIKEITPDLLIVSQHWHNDSSQDAIKSRILNLKGYVKNVLLIENTPIFPDASRFRLSGFLIAPFEFPKSYPISEMDIRDKKTSDELSAWARSHGFSTMNLSSLFCNSENCTRFSDVGWLYTDVSHLSLVGAELTYPQFSDFLKNF